MTVLCTPEKVLANREIQYIEKWKRLSIAQNEGRGNGIRAEIEGYP